MNTAQLSKVCRCGHPRRFHQQGTIWEAYSTRCTLSHASAQTPAEYRSRECLYFEAADGWQESFAKALRAEGYVVQHVHREQGRFVAIPEED